MILSEAQGQNFPIENVHIFSDGAGGQFKNRFILSLLTNPDVLNDRIQNIDWSFFATAHGKGPIDGIGGTVKRAVWRRILQNKVVINSAQEFAEVAKEACPNIKIICVPKEKVATIKKELDLFWLHNLPKTITDTRKFHHFQPVSTTELEAAIVTDFKQDANLVKKQYPFLSIILHDKQKHPQILTMITFPQLPRTLLNHFHVLL